MKSIFQVSITKYCRLSRVTLQNECLKKLQFITAKEEAKWPHLRRQRLIGPQLSMRQWQFRTAYESIQEHPWWCDNGITKVKLSLKVISKQTRMHARTHTLRGSKLCRLLGIKLNENQVWDACTRCWPCLPSLQSIKNWAIQSTNFLIYHKQPTVWWLFCPLQLCLRHNK